MKNKGFVHLLPLLIITGLVITVFYIGLNLKLETVNKTEPKIINNLIKIKESNTAPEGTRIVDTSPHLNLYLYKGKNKIAMLDESYLNNFVHINDWLFYANPTTYDYNIYALNLKTGKTEIILTKEQVLSKGVAEGLELELSKINEDLLVTFSGYLDKGYMIRLNGNNPMDGKISLFSANLYNHPEIYEYGKNFYLIYGFGDACASALTIYKFDYNNFKTTGDELFSFGTFTGTGLLGYSTKQNLFFYNDLRRDDSVVSGMCPFDYIENIKALDSSGNTTTVVDTSKFPKDVIGITLDDKNNKIYYVTPKELYYYNLLNNNIVDVGKLEKELDPFKSPSLLVIPEGGLCINDTLIDHTTGKTLQENSLKCNYVQPDAKKYFADLNLPDDFHIVRE